MLTTTPPIPPSLANSFLNYAKIETIYEYKKSYDDYSCYQGFVNNLTFESNVLKLKLESELEHEIKKSNYLSLINKRNRLSFSNIIDNFSNFSPIHLGVELTNSQSVFYFAIIESFKIHFEFFYDETAEDEFVALNIFENDQHLCSQSLNINDAFDYIKSIILEKDSKEFSQFDIPNNEEHLPTGATTDLTAYNYFM